MVLRMEAGLSPSLRRLEIVRDPTARLLAQFQQIGMAKRNGLCDLRIAVAKDKLYVHRVAMPQRDRGLQPLELDSQSPPKRVRPRLKFPEILHEEESVTLWTRS